VEAEELKMLEICREDLEILCERPFYLARTREAEVLVLRRNSRGQAVLVYQRGYNTGNRRKLRDVRFFTFETEAEARAQAPLIFEKCSEFISKLKSSRLPRTKRTGRTMRNVAYVLPKEN
jgi:hypothetical protein